MYEARQKVEVKYGDLLAHGKFIERLDESPGHLVILLDEPYGVTLPGTTESTYWGRYLIVNENFVSIPVYHAWAFKGYPLKIGRSSDDNQRSVLFTHKSRDDSPPASGVFYYVGQISEEIGEF